MSSHALPVPTGHGKDQHSVESETAGKIGFRLRRDLVAVRQPLGSTEIIAVKDPVSLNYFHFRPMEWFLLEQLRHPISLEEIQRRHQHKYPQTKISASDLKVLLIRAFRDGLLVATDAVHTGQTILQQKLRQQSLRRWTGIFQVLAIRFRGVDPEMFLELTAGLGRMLFSGTTFLLVSLASVFSVLMCLGQWEFISAKLPTLSEFFVGENLIYLLLALAGVKVLHELGHAMACKRFGGECHEIGFMLLAFMPCLYCNVSDTWMTPNRWKRIAVSVAGIFIEIILANLALFFWYFSQPGMFQSLCLNVVLICSINTLLLNGNPLLRYDGYYVLSDLLQVPNLAQQSRAAFWYPINCWITATVFSFRKWRIGLAFYALASMLYRLLVISAILWFVHMATKRWEMELLGNIISVVVVFGMVLPILISTVNYFRTSWNMQKQAARASGGKGFSAVGVVRWLRLSVVVAIVGVSGYLLWHVPLPHRVTSPLFVELDQPQWVFVPVEGKIDSAVEPGTKVQSGDVIAELSNSELQYLYNDLQSRISDATVRLQQLQNRVSTEPEVAFKIPVIEAELETNRILAETIQADLDRLVIRSGIDGVVFSRRQKPSAGDSGRFLTTWSGDPLARENRGAWLEKGEWLCLVGQPQKIRLVMPVDQTQIEFVQVGDKVRVKLDQVSDRVFDGKVHSISRENVQADEQEHTDLQNAQQQQNIERREYRVVVSFDPAERTITPGSTGIGKVVSQDRTIGQYVNRWFKQTLRFEY